MNHLWLYKENGTPQFSLLNSRQPLGKNIQVESWQQTTTNIISPSMFLLDRVGNGNDDISSEEHLKT